MTISYITAARRAAEFARDGMHGMPVTARAAEHRSHTLVRLPDVLRLSGIEFEHAIGNGLVVRGFDDVRVVGGPYDGGIDVVAHAADSGRLVVVQAKRYDPEYPVTLPMVEDFARAADQARAGERLFVTTSRFTEPAAQFAERAGIQAIDATRLMDVL